MAKRVTYLIWNNNTQYLTWNEKATIKRSLQKVLHGWIYITGSQNP
jgi:hypothetical protein